MSETITLPEALTKQVKIAAHQKGLEADELVIEAVEQYLAQEPLPTAAKARQRLWQLLKHKKETGDFMTAVHEAKAQAYELVEANQDWIDATASGSICGSHNGAGRVV